MARKQNILGVTGLDTVIGSGVNLKGNLDSSGDITVDGTLKGDIHAIGSVIIGANANVKANISASSVSINGNLNGNIISESEVAIGETAHVIGNIKCQSISIGLGAIFVGSIQMPPTDHASTNLAESVNTDIES